MNGNKVVISKSNFMIQLSNLERGIGYKDHFKNVKSLKSMKMIIFFVAVFALSQCKSSTNKFVAGELIEIDVSRTYPEKVLYLQDIAKVEYIPLETNSNTLMSSSAKIVHVSDDYIIASNTGEGDVFVFDGNTEQYCREKNHTDKQSFRRLRQKYCGEERMKSS